ncbi:MAG TPA: outer membrane beta-barrel domain-containing protein [Polyangiaceae bacterium]|nr:outer membrane beta-barrel domain-containing protein [Polyangiaceae bacterium]
MRASRAIGRSFESISRRFRRKRAFYDIRWNDLLFRLSPHSLFTLLLGAVILLGRPSKASAQCVDEALKQQLIGERAYRGVVPRLIKKSLRHELSGMGGWFAGDITDGAPTYGGAYTFHFTEDLGLEASYLRTREHYEILDAIVDRQQDLVGITASENNAMQFFMGHLIWSMAYGKVRWMGGGISRYDFYLSIGGGATVEPSVTGLTGSAGLGMKFYLTEWLALRWDVRDAIHQQKRVALGLEKIVNDITVTGGLSLFFPFHS